MRRLRSLTRLLITVVAAIAAGSALFAWGSQLSAQQVASITLPAPGATKALYEGCNNVALTFPDGTPAQSVANAVDPSSAVQAIWRHDAAQNRFVGFSPSAPQASDLQSVDFLDAVWLCVTGAPPPAPTPTLSPQEARLVEPGVYLIDPRDKTATRLTSGDYDVAPAWSPEGQLIASARLDANRTSGAIYLINRDGGNETRLAEGTRPLAWSPDGRIAFRGTSGDLYVVGTDGTGLVNLTEGRMRLSRWFGDGLSWSPDGQRIAFVADGSIYVIGDDGGNPTRLQAGEPHPRYMGGVPSWSPDGTSVLADAWFTDKPDILALNADGTGATPIAKTPASEGDAAWSPDGSRLAYWSYIVAPRQAVHVVGVDGTHEATVFESDSPNGFSGNVPSWSADGKHLAFLGEGSILCTVDADGSNLRVLVRVACSESPAVWSPDGGAIAVSVVPCGE